ncbi:MAG: hypothetical protein JW915_16925 [Chitinispirillaceae bacterium]|nr:hypothetical protein [Chitinispirillaceae bacterium]
MVKKESCTFLILIGTSLLAGFFVFFPIADGDIFWHLASGREIFSSKQFLLSDPFSYTTPGIQWIDLHWLFQVITYLIFSLTGYYGLLFFKSAVITCSVFLLFSLYRTMTSLVITAVLFLFCFYQCRYLVPLRPGILTLLYLSLFILLLENFQRSLRVKFLLPLIPLQILWVNTQGLFMIGPSVYILYILGIATDSIIRSKSLVKPFAIIRTKKSVEVLAVFLLICAAGLITPSGLKGFLFPFRLLRQITPGAENLYSSLIAENTPLTSLFGTDQIFYLLTFAILVLASLISIIIAGKKTRWAHLYLFLSFTVLALMAQRNLILFVFAVVPLLQSNFTYVRLNNTFFFNRFVVFGFTMITTSFFVFIAVLHFSMITSVHNPISPFCHPVKSTLYLKNNRISGTIFNADRYGGYLLWHLFPSHKVFIDTRLSMRNRSFFADYINILNSPPEQFKNIREQYDITAVVIPAHIPLYFGVARYLLRHPGWAAVICDGSEILFIRRDQNPVGIINFSSSTDLRSLFIGIESDPALKSPRLRYEATTRLKSFLLNMRLELRSAPVH